MSFAATNAHVLNKDWETLERIIDETGVDARIIFNSHKEGFYHGRRGVHEKNTRNVVMRGAPVEINVNHCFGS